MSSGPRSRVAPPCSDVEGYLQRDIENAHSSPNLWEKEGGSFHQFKGKWEKAQKIGETQKYVDAKAAGTVLRVAWLRLHGPYTLHRGHPDVRKERAGRRREDSAGRQGREAARADNAPLSWQEP